MAARLDIGRKRKAEQHSKPEQKPEPKPPRPGFCPLSNFIQDYYDLNQQTGSDYKRKDDLRNWIENSCSQFGYDHYSCYIVGSTSNGFGTKDSDVDVCLVINHDKVKTDEKTTCKRLHVKLNKNFGILEQ